MISSFFRASRFARFTITCMSVVWWCGGAAVLRLARMLGHQSSANQGAWDMTLNVAGYLTLIAGLAIGAMAAGVLLPTAAGAGKSVAGQIVAKVRGEGRWRRLFNGVCTAGAWGLAMAAMLTVIGQANTFRPGFLHSLEGGFATSVLFAFAILGALWTTALCLAGQWLSPRRADAAPTATTAGHYNPTRRPYAPWRR